MERMHEDGTTTPATTFTQGGSKMLIIVLVFLGIAAIVAIIVAGVAMDRSSSSSDGSTADGGTSNKQNMNKYGMVNEKITCVGSPRKFKTNSKGKRIYNIAIGHDYGAYEYIDKNGYLAGLSKDVITAACDEARVDCRLIWEPYTNCYVSKAGEHPRGGVGLLDGWYDACSNWLVTVPRIHVFKFSMSMLKTSLGVFYIKKTSSFKYDDYKNKKIGFLDGWAYDEKCLARNKDALPEGKIKHFLTTTDLYSAIINDEVDAGFAGIVDMKKFIDMGNSLIKMEGPGFECAVRGNGVMSRKDNPFPEIFNEGLSKLISNGRFAQICKDAKTTHEHEDRGIVDCVV